MKREGRESSDPERTVLDPASAAQGSRTLLPLSVGIYLQVTDGEDAGRRFDLSRGGAFTIGRRGSDIELGDPKVSRKHAEIQVLARDQYFVVDYGSRNGTWVNGVRLNRRRLRHNDVIRVGDTALQITVVESGLRPNGSARD